VANAKQLFLDLLLRDKTSSGSRSAAKNLKDVGDAAEDAAAGAALLGKESDKAENDVDSLGRSSKTTARHVADLEDEIKNVNRELMKMALAWKMADSAAEKADLSKGIRKTQRDLRELQKNKGLIGQLLGDPDKGGKSFGKKLAAGIDGGLNSVSTTLGSSVGPTIGGAIGVAAAPFLLSALSSAVSAGAGAGVLGVGIMAAVKGDSSIQDAGKAAGSSFAKGLEDSAKVLRGPVLDSLGILSAAGDRLNKNLAGTFADLSDDLVPFTRKVVGAAEAIEGSLLNAARKSGPALDGLGDSIGLLGDGVSKFIDGVADGGPQAAENMRLLAASISDTLAVTGKLIGEVSKMSDNPIFTGLFGKLIKDGYGALIEKTDQAAGSSDDLKGKQTGLADQMEVTNKAAREQADAFTELSNVLKSETDPVFGMLRAQDQLKEAQKGVTDALKEHGRNSPQYEEALRRQAEAALGLEAAAGKVATTSSGKLGPALRATLREAGFTERQIRDLERQFRNAKSAGDAFAKNYKARITADTAQAEANMKRAKRMYDAFRSKKITVSVYVASTVSDSVYNRLGDKMLRAEGGPVVKGRPYIVGEKRAEVFVPDSDGTIVPSVGGFMNSRGGGGAGGAMGGGATMIGFDFRGADTEFGRLFLRILRTQSAVRAEAKSLLS
jgi:hypothetical protein